MLAIYEVWLPLFFCLLALRVWGQSTITVTVGDTGSFYDPFVIAADIGDTVNFQWTGVTHSVTQSSFDDPCTPLPGGFDSQFQGNQAGGPQVIPQWNLTITNDTEPIWFFCKATKPMPHCISGMVGVINAPVAGVNESYDAFLAKAKSLTSIPPVVVGTPILTGIGAFATAPPANSRPSPSVTSSVSQSMTTSTSTTSTTNTPTATSSSSLSSGAKGGIIGGAVGAVVIIVIIVLLVIFWRRDQRHKRRAAMDEMRYHPPNQEIFHPQSNPSMSIGRRRSLGSTADSLDRDGSGTGSQTLNVKELAAEIARNMRQEHVIQEYPTEMPSPPLVPTTVTERSYGTIPSPSYSNSEFFQPPTPDSATTLMSQQQQQQQYHQQNRSYGSSHGSPSRQLPRPPPPPPPSSMPRGPRRPLDAISVDTLPAYASPH